MIIPLVVFLLQTASAIGEPAWSSEVVVRHGAAPVVRVQARVVGDYLMIRAKHEKGWHTYAMDNELRAGEALKGKMSLGIEQGIEIKVQTGLELDGPWLQTEPQDLSKPELRWFTFGFDETAVFACPIRKVSADRAILRIKGQACSGETCCQVDITMEVPVEKKGVVKRDIDGNSATQADSIKSWLDRLVPVKTKSREVASQVPGS